MYWRFEHSHPLLLECATILMVLLNLRCRFNRVSKSTVNSVWATIVREITSKWTNGKKPKKVYTYPHGRQTKQNTIKKARKEDNCMRRSEEKIRQQPTWRNANEWASISESKIKKKRQIRITTTFCVYEWFYICMYVHTFRCRDYCQSVPNNVGWC